MKVLTEAYDENTIREYAEEVSHNYRMLRDSLYSLQYAVEGIKDLELSARVSIIHLEDDRDMILEVLDDIEDYFKEPEEEEEDDYED